MTHSLRDIVWHGSVGQGEHGGKEGSVGGLEVAADTVLPQEAETCESRLAHSS